MWINLIYVGHYNMTNNKEQKIPQYVLRFYGETKYALECIALKQITFLHLTKLNDPFDLVWDFDTDFNDNYAFLLSCVQQQYPAQLAFFKERFPEQNWNDVVATWSKLANEGQETTFVFSTCGEIEGNHPCDNLYMWGHYGDGHRGIAIEFDTTVLGESLMKLGAPDSKSLWLEMEYKKEIPKIKCDDIIEFVFNAKPDTNILESYGPKLADVIRQRVHAKSEVWASENEWRLLLTNDESKLKFCRHDLVDNAVTAVYLGCRASEQIQKDIVHETRRNFPRANVFSAKMRKGGYALDFEKIA